MKRSTDAILTTHTGSLPRPDDLVDMLYAAEIGQAGDEAALQERVRSAVADSVREQIDAGIDIVNDGEQSKTGFANYIRDRLGGFEPVKDAARSGPPRTGRPRLDGTDDPGPPARAPEPLRHGPSNRRG